jgi:hypothetical protein
MKFCSTMEIPMALIKAESRGLFRSEPLYGEAEGGREHDRGDDGKQQHEGHGQTQDEEESAYDQSGEASDHVHLAVGEVDELHDAVHHGIAEGDKRVDAALGRAAQ